MDYYPSDPNATDFYHLNDADRLPNGNTLISVRNLNLVLEVDEGGKIEWSYGNASELSEISRQHNPVRLNNGNTLICDSGNDRIIEVDIQGNIVWSTESLQGIYLDFPRGVEKLPNGNVLISDSINNRHLEITMDGRIVWEVTNMILAYDADRVDPHAPDLEFVSPVNDSYSPGPIPIFIKSDARDLSDIWISLYDDTNSELILDDFLLENKKNYTISLQTGSFTIRAWANDTSMGNIMATSDHNPNIVMVVLSITVSANSGNLHAILTIILASTIIGIIIIIITRKKG
jgi:hypothetical protein